MTLAAASDAGPLIHLSEIESLELLSAFETLLVPETVYRELERGGTPEGMTALSYEIVDADEMQIHSEDLDAGERAAFAVANERDIVLLTDDLAARESASNDGIEVHGSIGVIALAYAQGVLSRNEAASRMRALQRETSLFVTDAVVERGIRLLEET